MPGLFPGLGFDLPRVYARGRRRYRGWQMSVRGDPRAQLRGRESECAALDALVEAAQAGESRTLVLRGEAGIGKTALLEYVAVRSEGCRVIRAAGVESEMELPFAAVHQLSMPLLDGLGKLPSPQRDALETAFGLSAGRPPDRFFVGLALLSLLSEYAEAQPLVCLVDDAQWLDRSSAQVLSFVARRLHAESVVVVLAERDGYDASELAGLPELRLHGLSEADAAQLVASVMPGSLDEAVRDRVIAEARGNPLALLELPRGRSSASLAGGFAIPSGLPLPRRIEVSYRRRVERLPGETRQILLAAAADPVGDPSVVWRAVAELGISSEAAAPAEADGLLEIGGRVGFRHPLVRSAIYGAASPAERRGAHRALAAATDPDLDPDRRAWHLAQAALAPDDDVAAELERSAGRAQARGGLAAAAAFLQHAVALTQDPAQRTERALAAAQASLQAGAPSAALGLVSAAETGQLDDRQRAVAHLIRGQAAFGSSRGADAPPLLLAAARELEPLDPALARDTYLDALSAALFVGRLAGEVGVVEVAQAARAAPASAARPQDLLLDGLALVITEGYDAGATLLKRAVGAFRTEEMAEADAIRWLWLATHAAHDLWDDESWEALCERHIGLARQAGALTLLPLALSARIGLHLFAGELATAASLNEEVVTVTEATGSGLPPYGTLAIAAFRGRETEAAELIGSARAELGPRGEGMGLTLVEHAAAVLYNGLGRYPDACEAAGRGAAHPQELAFSMWSLPQLIEAATRSNEPALAHDAMQRLEQSTGTCGTDWALGVEARSRALISDDRVAEPFYRDAIERLGRTRVHGERARAHLLYGEWLRRQGRRMDAREQLRTAHGMFTDMGMEAFAERARRELHATGERVRRRAAETRDQLTPQEAQIAQLASDGLTNPEIGARFFLSARTVEWHLRKVFAKLGVSSRRELRAAFPKAGPAFRPAS